LLALLQGILKEQLVTVMLVVEENGKVWLLLVLYA